MFKLIPLLCTHVYSYMFSAVHPPRIDHIRFNTIPPSNYIPNNIEIQTNVMWG